MMLELLGTPPLLHAPALKYWPCSCARSVVVGLVAPKGREDTTCPLDPSIVKDPSAGGGVQDIYLRAQRSIDPQQAFPSPRRQHELRVPRSLLLRRLLLRQTGIHPTA